MRIVSLLPGATEMICALGLQEYLVGVSHECDYPSGVSDLPKLTASRLPINLASDAIDQQVRALAGQDQALFDLNEDLLVELAPDVIVSQSLCDVCAVSDTQVRAAAGRMHAAPTVVRLNPARLDDVLDDMLRIGRAAGTGQQADQAVAELRARIETVVGRVSRPVRSTEAWPEPTVLLLEWIDPLFAAGHWNPELIQIAGGRPVLGTAGEKSRQVEWDDVLAADPEYLIVACCGLSIDRTLEDLPRLVSYRSFGKLKCIERGQVFLADGSQYFNRPGPRLVDSLELLANAIDSQMHPLAAHLEPLVRIKRA